MTPADRDALRAAVVQSAEGGARDGLRCCGAAGAPGLALTRRRVLGALRLGFGLAAAPRAARAATASLRIGVIPSDHYAALYVALETRMFEEQGFSQEVKVFPGGPPMLEAFAAGQLDISDRVVVLDAHPGRVREVVAVPWARPRKKSSPESVALVERLWGSISQMARRQASG